jgi:hypothetical protein
MDLLIHLAQDYGSKPLGEKIGYVVGIAVILILIVWAAATLIKRSRRR